VNVLFFGCRYTDLPEGYEQAGIDVTWPDTYGHHGRDKRVADAMEKRLRHEGFEVLVLWTGQLGHSSANFLSATANKMQIPVLRRSRPSTVALLEVLAHLVEHKRQITVSMEDTP